MTKPTKVLREKTHQKTIKASWLLFWMQIHVYPLYEWDKKLTHLIARGIFPILRAENKSSFSTRDCSTGHPEWGSEIRICIDTCVISWFVELQCKKIHQFFMWLWGCKFMGKGNPRNPVSQTSIPHKQWCLNSCSKSKILSLKFEILLLSTSLRYKD